MFVSGSQKIHFTELPAQIEGHLRGHEAFDLDVLVHDLQACSFLTTDSAGFFRFCHKSFLEYFAAEKIVKELRNGATDSLGKRRLTQEICDFLLELGATSERSCTEALQSIIDEARVARQLAAPEDVQSMARVLQFDTSTAVNNALDLFAKSSEGLSVVNFTGMFLTRIQFTAGTSFDKQGLGDTVCSDVIFNSCQLSDAVMNNVRWERVNLNEIEGRQLSVRQSVLKSCSFRNASIPHMDISDTTFEGGTLSGADLRGSQISKCTFSAVSLREAVIRDSVFTDCSFTDCDFSKVSVRGALLRNTEFKNCTADRSLLRNGMLKEHRL